MYKFKSFEHHFSEQVEKCIMRAINSSKNRHNYDVKRELNFKIKSEVVNRLKTKNLIQKIKDDQLKKIDSLGKSLHLDFNQSYEPTDSDAKKTALLPIKDISERLYYKKKFNHIRNKLTEEKIAEHEIFYSDGLMMIGYLAATLPKHSDSPEHIWEQLLKPLTE